MTNGSGGGGGIFALIFYNKSRRIASGWTKSSSGMKAGYFNMTLGQGGRAGSRNLQAHPVPRKSNPRSCWFVSSTAKAYCLESLFHLVRLSTRRLLSLQFSERLRQRNHYVTWELFPDKRILRYDEHSHTALSVTEFLAKRLIVALEHTDYWRDLAPCDHLLFPIMKNHLKKSHSETMKESRKVAKTILNNLHGNNLRKSLDSWNDSEIT